MTKDHRRRITRPAGAAVLLLAVALFGVACSPTPPPVDAGRLPTVVTVSAVGNSVVTGDAEVLFGNVVSSGGGAPTGTVSFFDNDAPIGTADVRDQTATVQQMFTVPGNHILTAHYSGDSTYLPSESGPTSFFVTNPKPTAISAGAHHTCALRANGTIKCWGSNARGQLGDGTRTSTSHPVGVSSIEDAVAVSAGGLHTCAVLADTTVKCWGLNSSGQLGNGSYDDSTTPVAVAGLSGVTQISAGDSHTCARLSDGTVDCWGYNHDGQLGNQSTATSPTPVPVSFLINATQVSAGLAHSCAVVSDGSARCWGSNSDGQLGIATPASSSVIVTVGGLTDAQNISAGDHYTCSDPGSGWGSCWGAGWSATPQELPLAAHPLDVGAAHACGIYRNGTGPAVACFGDNSFGQLGDATTANGGSVRTYTTGNAVSAASAGGNHSCMLEADGTVECWGDNHSGELGNDTAGQLSVTPVQVQDLTYVDAATSISVGDDHSCAVMWNGSVRCWGGYNLFGQLGAPGVGRTGDPPVEVFDVTNAASVSVGTDHSCAVLTDGGVECWGANNFGQSGPNSVKLANRVEGVTGATQVAAGLDHSCALLIDRTVSCWGRNSFGALGTQPDPDVAWPSPGLFDATRPVEPPQQVPGLTGVLSISAGQFHTCAILSDHTVTCWGASNDFYGQYGHRMAYRAEPTAVPGISTAISFNERGDCALLARGGISCWETDGWDTRYFQSFPTPPTASKFATSLDHNHGCAIVADGVVDCWGSNSDGQLGFFGNSDAPYPPTPVHRLSAAARSVGAASWFSCAVLSDGRVDCWGTNGIGTLGTGSIAPSEPIPAPILGQ